MFIRILEMGVGGTTQIVFLCKRSHLEYLLGLATKYQQHSQHSFYNTKIHEKLIYLCKKSVESIFHWGAPILYFSVKQPWENDDKNLPFFAAQLYAYRCLSICLSVNNGLECHTKPTKTTDLPNDQISGFWVLTQFQDFDLISGFWPNFRILTKFQDFPQISGFIKNFKILTKF